MPSEAEDTPQHPQPSSPLHRELNDEWTRLNAQPSSRIALRRWSRHEPALAGYPSLDSLIEAVRTCDVETADELLRALLRVFQKGQQLAGRAVLQVMLPRLVTMARRTSPRSSEDELLADRQHILIAEAWDTMVHFHTNRPTRGIRTRLALDTLHRVAPTQRWRARHPEIPPTDPARFEWARPDTRFLTALDRPSHAQDPSAHDPSDTGLSELLQWAIEDGVVSNSEGQMLMAVYGAEDFAGADYAAEHGLTLVAVRKRCSRAVAKIKAAVRAEIADERRPSAAPRLYGSPLAVVA